MKTRITGLLCILIFGVAGLAIAADTLVTLPIGEALDDLEIKKEISEDIKLYWGEQDYPKPETVYGEFKTSQRTNAFGKSREDACQWALASSIKELQARARREGGNAVVNIKSNIQNREKSSETDFDCLSGTLMVNVALKGTVVKLPE